MAASVPSPCIGLCILDPGTGFTLGNDKASISISDSVGTLYVANLRPSAAAGTSAAPRVRQRL